MAVGFAAKRWAPRTSLAWLMLAPIFIDLLWSVFILTGIERARITPGITKSVPLELEFIPISHSLVAAVGWALLLGGAHFALQREQRVALVLFLGVMSHWLLDWISHRPDMPLLPSGPHVGLGLWNYPLAAWLTESVLLAIGVFLYASATRARGRTGRLGLIVFALVLFGFNCAAYVSAPPPSVLPMAAGNLSMLLFVWAAYGLDRSREPTL